MNFNENDLWGEKTELLRLSKLARAKVLLRLEFDTKDQVLFYFFFTNGGGVRRLVENSAIIFLNPCLLKKKLRLSCAKLRSASPTFAI